MTGAYSGVLTQEQFLFFEIRTVAGLVQEGWNRAEMLGKIKADNLFQFPTERKISAILSACLKRINALNSPKLTSLLAHGPAETAKQVNLYAMMKYNRIVWDFMTEVVAEKFRTQDWELSRADLNAFFFELREKDERVALWSENTVGKIKQVLKKSLAECGYLNSSRETRLQPISAAPELQEEIRAKRDFAALPAFNCFD